MINRQMISIALLFALAAASLVSAAGEKAAPGTKGSPDNDVASASETKPASPSIAMAKAAVTTPQEPAQFKAEHPGDTALSQDEAGQWQFRSFPGLATLYVYDRDSPGKSNCAKPCTSAWAPLRPSSSDHRQIGDWTQIEGPDGREQWAYKGRPVYLRYHDLPHQVGNIERQGFHKLEP